jgi:putative flippase GtrA
MLRFGMVGFAGFAIDRILLQGAISILGMNAFTGRLLSFSLAVVCTWLLNRSFTFRHDHHHAPLKQAMIYVAVQVTGGVLNVGVYEVAIWLIPALKAHLLIPLAFGSAAGLCVTYAGSKRFAFRRAEPEAGA